MEEHWPGFAVAVGETNQKINRERLTDPWILGPGVNRWRLTAQVDVWVQKAEAGCDVDELRKRATGRPARGAQPSQVVPVRLTAEELAAVLKRADREQLNRSEAIRAALSEWSRAA